jgi:hypothetical protein
MIAPHGLCLGGIFGQMSNATTSSKNAAPLAQIRSIVDYSNILLCPSLKGCRQRSSRICDACATTNDLAQEHLIPFESVDTKLKS